MYGKYFLELKGVNGKMRKVLNPIVTLIVLLLELYFVSPLLNDLLNTFFKNSSFIMFSLSILSFAQPVLVIAICNRVALGKKNNKAKLVNTTITFILFFITGIVYVFFVDKIQTESEFYFFEFWLYIIVTGLFLIVLDIYYLKNTEDRDVENTGYGLC